MKVFKINDKVISRINSEGIKVALGPQPPPTIVATDGSLVMNGLWTYDSLYVRLRCDGFSGPVTVHVEEPAISHNIEVTVTNNIIEFTSDELLGVGRYGVGQVWHYMATITATDATGRTATAVANFEIKNSWNYVDILPNQENTINVPEQVNTFVKNLVFYAVMLPSNPRVPVQKMGRSEDYIDFTPVVDLYVKNRYEMHFSGSNHPRNTYLQNDIEYYVYELIPYVQNDNQNKDYIHSTDSKSVQIYNKGDNTVRLLCYRDEVINSGRVGGTWANTSTNNPVVESVSTLTETYRTGQQVSADWTTNDGLLYPYVYTVEGDSASRQIAITYLSMTLSTQTGTRAWMYIINEYRKKSNEITLNAY